MYIIVSCGFSGLHKYLDTFIIKRKPTFNMKVLGFRLIKRG